MSKTIIGTVVGGLIFFFWQFLSWSMLNIHGAETQYTPQQDKILNFLNESNLEEGNYFMPTVPPGASAEDQAKLGEATKGKPWVQIFYHKAYDTNMGMNLFRGIVIDLIAVFLLCWILLQFSELTFGTAVMASLAIGFTGYLTIPYLNHIWFETSTIGYLIDTLVQWGLVGAWLGWWLTRK